VIEDTALLGKARRPGKRLTSPERWEVTQLIKSGVLDVTEYPTFDEEGGTVCKPIFHSSLLEP
jgi:ATP-dependent RNA helicase DHX8/PRP22